MPGGSNNSYKKELVQLNMTMKVINYYSGFRDKSNQNGKTPI